jgi:hypothetical protein
MLRTTGALWRVLEPRAAYCELTRPPIPVSLPSGSWNTYFHTSSCFSTSSGSMPWPGDSDDLGNGIVDPDHADRATGPVKITNDIHVAILGQLPHSLDVAGVERRLGTEQAFVPIQRLPEVVDRDASEDTYRHQGTASLFVQPRSRLATGRPAHIEDSPAAQRRTISVEVCEQTVSSLDQL